VRLSKTLLLITACLAQPLAGQATDSLALARRVVAAASLAAKEYALGVVPAGGQITQPEEVDEAKLFIQQAQFDVPGLPLPARAKSQYALAHIAQLLEALAAPDSVSRATDSLVALITAAAGGPKVVEPLPNRPPSLERGALVYREQCAACHGESGRGDGPKAKSLKGPPPANLADPAVMGNKSLLDIFRRIAVGTPGTAMPEFAEDLPAEDRWAVASYVAAMQYGGSATAAVFAAVRHQIDSAFARRSDKIAVDAYMTFEQVETAIRAKNAGLASELEGNFAWLRTRVAKADDAERHTIRERLLAGLERAERVVADRQSGMSLFVASFFLLVREGFEAILIVAALMTFLAKAGASERRREVARGAWAAVGASLITWVLVELLFQVTPGQREMIEGVTMLVAAAVLFYVRTLLRLRPGIERGRVPGRVPRGVRDDPVLQGAVHVGGREHRTGRRRNRGRRGRTRGDLPARQSAGTSRGDETVLRGDGRDALLHGVRVRGEGRRGAAGRGDHSVDRDRRRAAHSRVRHLPDRGVVDRSGTAVGAGDRRRDLGDAA